MGGGCSILGLGCGVASFAQGAISPSATTWILGADLGWSPVTNLNFDLELMYQSTNQSAPSGFLGTVYNWGQANNSSCRAIGTGSATVSRAASASPVTSDRVPISSTLKPRSESSGVFCSARLHSGVRILAPRPLWAF